MTVALLVLAAALAGAVVALLAVVIAGIRLEPRGAELSTRPPGPIAAVVRRLLGLSVRRPDPPADDAGRRHEACLAGHTKDGSTKGGSR